VLFAAVLAHGAPAVAQADAKEVYPGRIDVQTIYVNPKRHVVIVQTAAWPEPDPDDRWDETIKVMQTLARRIEP
jgi:hypothetical protein